MPIRPVSASPDGNALAARPLDRAA